jgi:hypothetical protein
VRRDLVLLFPERVGEISPRHLDATPRSLRHALHADRAARVGRIDQRQVVRRHADRQALSLGALGPGSLVVGE